MRPSQLGSRPWRARESQRTGLVTETHHGQREIANKAIIVRLFLRKGSSSLRACAKFREQRYGRLQLPAPSLAKSAVRH